jgi:lipopolysaccharide export system permease protein
MSILNRYLYRQTFAGLVLAFAIIISLVALVDYVELSRRFGSFEQVSSLTILHLTALRVPGEIEQTLPFIVLFGVMWSMFRLNRRSELVAMRAAGQSAWIFATPPTLIAFLLGIVGVTAINPFAADSSAKFDEQRVEISRTVGANVHGDRGNIWLREALNDGTLIIHADDAIARNAELLGVSFTYYTLDEQERPVFKRRLDADGAKLGNGFWNLYNVRIVQSGSLPEKQDNMRVETNLDSDSLLEYLAATSYLSFWDLPAMIKNTRTAKLDSRKYELQWFRLLALPLTLAAMALIGAAFSLRLVRLGGIFQMAVTGGAIGFGLYFAGDLLEALGATRVLPPFVAVWSAPTFVFFAGLARITIVEDG